MALISFKLKNLFYSKEKKKDYERQTVKYCNSLEKYLQSQYSKREKNNSDEYTEIKEVKIVYSNILLFLKFKYFNLIKERVF